jgi:hypothetical protein
MKPLPCHQHRDAKNEVTRKHPGPRSDVRTPDRIVGKKVTPPDGKFQKKKLRPGNAEWGITKRIAMQ